VKNGRTDEARAVLKRIRAQGYDCDQVTPHQGVTKRCRLSWLTISALVYDPKCGRRGRVAGVSANEYSSSDI
jgi:pentatricopeptide repeat protein